MSFYKKMLISFLWIVVSVYAGQVASLQPYDYIPGKIVVKVRNEDIDLQAISEIAAVMDFSRSEQSVVEKLFPETKVKNINRARTIGLNRIYEINILENTDIPELCRLLNEREDIEWAEPVYIIPQHSEPNDPIYPEQYHLPQIHMPEAWDVVKGDSIVPIGIIDSGVDWTHPDLADKIWVNPGEDVDGDGQITAVDSNSVDDDGNGFVDDFIGWDWVDGVSGSGDSDAAPDEDGEDEDNNPMDVNGHGSHVAGLSAAATNNGVGVASVSWGCRIMPLRIGWKANDGNGYGLSVWMSQAFIYAADNGAKVTNLSYGNSQVVLEGAGYAFANDVCIATSAGNSNDIITDPLSVAPWAMTVTAVDNSDHKTWYSSFGEAATVAAPGGAVTSDDPGLWSTFPNNNYGRIGGTSMASPVCAGLLALVRSQHPEWSAAKTYYQVEGTTDNIDDINPDYAGLLGSGRINGYRAVTETVIPAPKLTLERVDFDDITGDQDGLVEPGEQVEMVVHLRNDWAGTANVTASIFLNDDEDRVTLQTSTVQFDTIYGLQDFGVDNTNQDSPFLINIAEGLPPSMVPIYLVIQSEAKSDTFTVHLPIHPLVLFVDDHLGGGDGKDMPIADYYFHAFKDNGIAFDYWLNTQSPDSNFISKFPVVVWGCEWAFPSLSENDRNVLAYYLENGGRLFLSGQDIGWDLCDQSSNSNQYFASEGTSKDWYETYLSAEYLSDAGGVNPLSSISGNYLDGLGEFTFSQPNRPLNIYPSVIQNKETGVQLLQYANGGIAAVSSNAPYRTSYFSFGGFEAIEDSLLRDIVMKKTVNYLTDFKLSLTKLKNTEFTGPFPVEVNYEDNKVIDIAQLWYRYDNGDWQSADFSDAGNGLYQAEIPAISGDSAHVEYYVFFKAADNTYHVNPAIRFFSGPDVIKPMVNEVNYPQVSIDRSGPYNVGIALTDNIAVDTSSVWVHYLSSGVAEDSVLLMYEDNGLWKGQFQFENYIQDYDSVSLYFTYRDMAVNRNYGRAPVSGYFSFSIQPEVLIDDFEEGLSKWKNDESDLWSIYTDPSFVSSGIRCLISSDGLTYPPGIDAAIGLLDQVNLKSRYRARLKLLEAHFVEDTGDTCFVEIGTGDSWTQLGFFAGEGFAGWNEYLFDLSPYCGDENSPFSIRFRLKSDENYIGRPGFLIDKVQILADDAVNVDNQVSDIPAKFSLENPYPNPFNSQINISFSLPGNEETSLSIFDLTGREVLRKEFSEKEKGRKEFIWNGRDARGISLPSGVYLVALSSKNKLQMRKIILLK